DSQDGVKDAWNRQFFRKSLAVDRTLETGCALAGGFQQCRRVMRSRRRQRPVVLGDRQSHPDLVEQPCAQGRQRRGLEIEMHESLGGGLFMLMKEAPQIVSAKMMKDAGGEKDVRRFLQLKGVRGQEVAA